MTYKVESNQKISRLAAVSCPVLVVISFTCASMATVGVPKYTDTWLLLASMTTGSGAIIQGIVAYIGQWNAWWNHEEKGQR